jgi:predicted 2-oxoglutarate/Fe(II)-dependent dioxygenase YbiX
LEAICQEAEFFGLPELAKECMFDDVVTPLRAYETIRSFIANAGDGKMRVDHPSGSTTPLLKALGTMWAPFCVRGKLSLYNRSQVVFKSSTIGKLNVPELVAAAAPSPFGRGTETVTDLNVRDSLEISADKLNPSALSAISNHVEAYFRGLCPNTPTHLKPYKLVIYQQGGHFDQHRDTVRGDGHIGTVVVILNSEYTGGELEITHGGKTEVVTGPNNWVAMYGDCLHKINPVTSGTRVSLIYDIYAAVRRRARAPMVTAGIITRITRKCRQTKTSKHAERSSSSGRVPVTRKRMRATQKREVPTRLRSMQRSTGNWRS